MVPVRTMKVRGLVCLLVDCRTSLSFFKWLISKKSRFKKDNLGNHIQDHKVSWFHGTCKNEDGAWSFKWLTRNRKQQTLVPVRTMKVNGIVYGYRETINNNLFAVRLQKLLKRGNVNQDLL